MKQRIAGLLLISGALFLAGCGNAVSTGAKTGDGKVKESVSGVVELTDMNFGTETAQGVVLVDFWAPWCGPCRMQGPIVEKAAEQLGGKAKVAKVNVDKAPQTAQKFGIQSIPTLIVFKNGKSVKQFVGVTQAAELVAAVQAAQ